MLVIAHRGASGTQPENTLLAFEEAIAMKVDAIELDVHAVEGQLVVIHDRWLHKTTDGNGRVIDLSFAQIRALNAGKGQKVPTLWESLKVINGKSDINIELKSKDTVEPLLKLLDDAIEELSFTLEQFLISSFNHHLLLQLKKRKPDIKIAPLIVCGPIEHALFAEHMQAYSVHLDVDFVTSEFIDDAHARGIKIFVYTVDEPLDLKDMQTLGVDGVFTNFPDKAMMVLAHKL